MERISVLLVDDHRVVRQGLRDFLELQDDIEVVWRGLQRRRGRQAGPGSAARRGADGSGAAGIDGVEAPGVSNRSVPRRGSLY